MAFDHEFGYSFPLFFSLLKEEERRKGEWIIKDRDQRPCLSDRWIQNYSGLSNTKDLKNGRHCTVHKVKEREGYLLPDGSTICVGKDLTLAQLTALESSF